VKPFLSTIKPMKAAVRSRFREADRWTEHQERQEQVRTALQIKEDIASFRKTSRASRLVTCWCGSTESFVKPEEVHSTPEKFIER